MAQLGLSNIWFFMMYTMSLYFISKTYFYYFYLRVICVYLSLCEGTPHMHMPAQAKEGVRPPWRWIYRQS